MRRAGVGERGLETIRWRIAVPFAETAMSLHTPLLAGNG
jgi:hypothetical protein